MNAKKKILLLSAFYLLVCLVPIEQVNAFEYAGQAWCCDTINYYVNPTNPSSACGNAVVGLWFQNRINTAASAWNALGTRFQLVNVGTTSAGCIPNASGACEGTLDGQNTISMATNCAWSDGSIIAYSTWWYWTTGDTAGCIYESDICFNDDITWYDNVGSCSGSCYDLISVAEHEIGHWVASNHENDVGILGYRPIMYWAYAFCEMRRTVTADDTALVDWAYDSTGVIPLPARTTPWHDDPPYMAPPNHQNCSSGQPCDSTIFCDSLLWDPCILVCPASDVVYSVITKDSCGNPVCDPNGIALSFANCPAIPCPDEEPNWPLVYPDSCNPATGENFFTVDASLLNCTSCEAQLLVGGAVCAQIPARFLDNDGDGCVTQLDYVGGRVCDDFNCDFASDPADSAIWAAHEGHCCGTPPCDPGQPFCDSVVTDPCLLVCPASDIVFSVWVKDSCGNPICDPAGTWLDFSGCTEVIPCPGEEPNWPLVFSDSCDTITGEHFFTVDAGYMDPTMACNCEVALFINGFLCRTIPVRFLDITGDLCVTAADWGPLDPCNDYDCNGLIDSIDSLIHVAHLGDCCGQAPCDPGPAFCDSVTTDTCLVICPASDIVWTATVKDSCGNPVCDPGIWLDFSSCEAQPCPGEEPNWPIVYPDSCDTATGVHYFTVDAGLLGCVDCFAHLYVDSQYCRDIPAKFLDVNGDLCVTPDDWLGALPCNDYDCDGTISANDMGTHSAHLDHCCAPPCPPGPPFCDSVTTDSCLVICPASDIVFTVNVKDSCGNPICDTSGTWLDFSGCPAIPCPNEEPNWPRVYPDSCDPVTGDHFFTVDAGLTSCAICDAGLYVNGAYCRSIPAYFLDHTGDLCVTGADWMPGVGCNDYNCDGIDGDVADLAIHNAHLNHCCTPPCDPGQPFCDSVTTDPCLLVCPASDIVFSVWVKDSCGNPICDPAGTWLDFSGCSQATPCPGEEPNWPEVFSDSCDTITGEHYFTVDAGIGGCVDCQVSVFVAGQFCLTVPARFMDTNGDLCVDSTDWVGAVGPCNDYNCDGAITMADSVIHANHINHCCNADGSIQGHKFDDHNCNGVFDANETLLSGWTINLHQYGNLIASTTTDAFGSYSFDSLCPGKYWVTEVVSSGWVQTAPPTAGYFVDLGCGEIIQNLDFGNKVDTCDLLLSTAFQVAGTKDNFVGSEPSSPGADLIPLLNCGNGMNNWFDSTMINKCFGHTFTGFWDTTCCILGGQLCLKVKGTGPYPNTDAIVIAENGVQIWTLSMNDLQAYATGGLDTIWSAGDIMEICLDLENLPPSQSNGITNVVAALGDGDFDVKFQDDTEVDYLELRVELCCDCCNGDGIRGDVNYDGGLDVGDITYLVDYLFKGGPPPPCFEEGDVNGDGSIDVADLTYLVDYLFNGGPPPPPCP